MPLCQVEQYNFLFDWMFWLMINIWILNIDIGHFNMLYSVLPFIPLPATKLQQPKETFVWPRTDYFKSETQAWQVTFLIWIRMVLSSRTPTTTTRIKSHCSTLKHQLDHLKRKAYCKVKSKSAASALPIRYFPEGLYWLNPSLIIHTSDLRFTFVALISPKMAETIKNSFEFAQRTARNKNQFFWPSVVTCVMCAL